MANLDYLHELILSDGIKDSVTSWSQPVFILPGYFLASQWTRVLCQLAQALDHKIAQDFVKI